MSNRLTDKNGEVRELTEKDFANAQPAKDVLANIVGKETAEVLLHRKQGERGVQKAPTKQAVSIRLSPEILAYFKSTGKGWQTRINEALGEYVASR